MTDSTFWSEKRKLVPQPDGRINLNAGTLSPTPYPVLDAVSALRREQASSPSDFVWRRAGPLLEEARWRLAAYIGCAPPDLLLLPNVTFAINILANSLQLPAGSEILTTYHEYGAMLHCWRRIAKRRGWSVRQIELPFRAEDPDEIVGAFDRGISDQTRVLFFSHATTSTGLVLPAKQICALARERGLLSVVDGAHAPGMVPVNLAEIGADFYGANCHKWMMCPAGAGFLHVRRDRRELIESQITSWGYDYDRSRPDESGPYGGTHWQWDYEFHGTVDRCPQMVIPHALDFREDLGGDGAVAARVRDLSQYARGQLAGIGLTSVTPENPSMSGAIVAFEYPCDDPVAVRERMWQEHGIECPVTIAAGRTFLRVSTAWFNTPGELDRLTDAVTAMRKR